MKTLILCNGKPPSLELFNECRRWADFFIAADGGGNIAREFQSIPDVVIGDMDSFTKHESDDFEMVFDPDQETNDLEKALKRAISEGSRDVVVLGATGKRLDQTLKNLSVLKQFNDKFDSLIFRDNHLDTFLLPDNFSKDMKIGTQVSLFPLSGEVSGIQTKGLRFPLNNEKLINGVRDGSSNEVVGSPVHITHKKGDLLMLVVTD